MHPCSNELTRAQMSSQRAAADSLHAFTSKQHGLLIKLTRTHAPTGTLAHDTQTWTHLDTNNKIKSNRGCVVPVLSREDAKDGEEE